MRRAVILAAGMGRRLGLSYPKALLHLGGKTILERAIYILYKQNIRDIAIITGYREDRLRRYVSDLKWLPPDVKIVCLLNNRYSETNNIYSLWLAKKFFADNSFVLINSDVLFHSSILTLLLNSEHETALLLDDSKGLGLEEMKVTLDSSGLVKGIDKEIDPKRANGEYIGIAKFGGDSVFVLSRTLDLMIRQDYVNLFYESALQLMCKEVDIYAVSTQQLPWIEVDTPEDLKEATTEIYPRLDPIL